MLGIHIDIPVELCVGVIHSLLLLSLEQTTHSLLGEFILIRKPRSGILIHCHLGPSSFVVDFQIKIDNVQLSSAQFGMIASHRTHFNWLVRNILKRVIRCVL